MNLLFALGASIIVSFVSLIGALALIFEDKLLKRIIIFLVAFAAGGLMGGAFLHILPESMAHAKDPVELFLFVILGFMVFFAMEKYLYWHHCHDTKCEVHMFTYLNIAGDIIHNLSDGLIMGAVFALDIKLGIATTIAIIAHEIPHELGNFMVLVFGGFGKFKALLFNFISALFAVLGTVCGYYFSHKMNGFSGILLPMAAGGFIYIASCDLVPQLCKEPDLKKSTISMLTFTIGVALMYILKIALG